MPQRKFPLIPVALAVAAVAFVAYAAVFWLVIPWRDYGTQLADLDVKINEKVKQIIQVRKERAALDRFEAMSLPITLVDAQLEYDRYLNELLARHNVTTISLRYSGSSPRTADQKAGVFGGNKKAETIYTALTYKLDAQASLANLTAMLREFDEAPLMHRIRSLDVKPADSDEKKDSKKTSFKSKSSFPVVIHMEFEGIIVEGAIRRPTTLLGPDERLVEISALTLLKRGPGCLALIPWVVGPVGPVAQAKNAKAKAKFDYGRIDHDNIFIGYHVPEKIIKAPPKEIIDDTPPPPAPPKADPYDMREFYKLILISKTPDGDEAWLYSPFKDHNIRLKTRPGFNQFAITDMEGEKTLLKGKVLKIDYGAVYFETNARVYCIQRGENLKEAIKQSIPDSELSKIGLKIAKAP